MISLGILASAISAALAGPVSFVASSPTDFTTSTSQVVSIPVATETGDLLLAWVMHRSALTTPSGWEVVATCTTSLTFLQSLTLLKRTAQSGDSGASTTFTQASSGRMAVEIQVFRADGGADVLSTLQKFNNGTGVAAFTAPGMQGTTTGQMIASAASMSYANTDDTTTMAVSSGWTITTPTTLTQSGQAIRLGAAYIDASTTVRNFATFTSDYPPASTTNEWQSISVLLGVSPVDPTSDVAWSSVHSLLHFDDGNGATTFADQKGNTWTRQSTNVVGSNTKTKFGASSLYIPDLATGDYISTPASAIAGDFTVDAWIYPTDNTGVRGIFFAGDLTNNANRLMLSIENKFLVFWGQESGTGWTSISLEEVPAGVWSHVRMTRIGNLHQIYLNGQIVGSVSNAGKPSSLINFVVGASRSLSVVQNFLGYIDDFRLTIGTGRDSGSNFIPRSTPYPNS